MKKIMFLLIISLYQAMIAASNPLEVTFRAKYPHLDIPKFEYKDIPADQSQYAYNNGDNNFFFKKFFYCGDYFFDWLDGKENFSWNTFVNNMPKAEEARLEIGKQEFNDFIILHELGHRNLSQKGLTYYNTQKINTAVGLFTLGLWGKHKIKPYRNRITKISSKCIAAWMTSSLSKFCLGRFDETYADNFACSHIKDKDSLEQVIQDLKKDIQEDETTYKEIQSLSDNKMWKYVGTPMLLKAGELWLQDRHPSRESRLKKFERILKERFET